MMDDYYQIGPEQVPVVCESKAMALFAKRAERKHRKMPKNLNGNPALIVAAVAFEVFLCLVALYLVVAV